MTIEKLIEAKIEAKNKKEVFRITSWTIYMVLLFSFCALLYTAITTTGLYNFGDFASLLAFLLILLGIVVCANNYTQKEYYKALEKYKSCYIEYFVVNGLEDKFTNVKYSQKSSLDYKELKDSHMLKVFENDDISSCDMFTGTYSNVDFSQSNLHVATYEIVNHETKKLAWKQIYWGRWITIEINKPFKGDIEVASKDFKETDIPLYLFDQTTDEVRSTKIKNEEFERSFNVFAQYDSDVKELLTPKVVEAFVSINNRYEGYFLCGFAKDKMYIGIQEDFIPSDPYKKLDDKKERERINKEMEIITFFIDNFASKKQKKGSTK